MPISTPATISFPLDIPQVDVLATKQTRDNKFIITIESRRETTSCGICKKEIACTYGHGQAVRLRHLPILGQETYIIIQPRRAQCPTCRNKPTTTQTLKWYDQRSPHTKAYDRYLMKLLISSTVADVSLKENLGYDAVLGALERQVDKEINWDAVQNLGTIGIDEVAHKKGHKSYRAVVTARQDDGTILILTVLNDRKKTVSDFLMSIPKRLHSTIHTFCFDMWDGYLGAIAAFMTAHPDIKAKLVIDRFHVAKTYRDDFDTLRKKEMRRLRQELPEATYKEVVHGMHWVLRHNYDHLNDDDKVRLRSLFQYSPLLHQAYTLREELTAIFNMDLGLTEGRRRLEKWSAKVERSTLTCFNKFLKTLRNHLDEIANYFDKRASSGFVEGINNKLKTIARRSYGLKRVDSLFRRLWLDLNGYRYFIA
ncbi:MAG: ISL3 family transposase [Anaerolineae bacterium]